MGVGVERGKGRGGLVIEGLIKGGGGGIERGREGVVKEP